ncbi:MAG: archaeosine biosynthesis radical SAM protein RaSEA [Promethearchaeota archaeon]
MNVKSPISTEIYKLRKKQFQNHEGKTGLVATWTEETPLISKRGMPVLSQVIILSTRGCEWALSDHGGCSMCGYINDSSRRDIDQSLILKQITKALDKHAPPDNKTVRVVKIFNSGSFFDDKELYPQTRHQILRQLAKNPEIQEVAVESRPEYINEEKLNAALDILGEKKLIIGIGVESTSDRIRIECINKGFTFYDIKKATSLIIDRGAFVKAYLLLKPPFLTEIESLWDTYRSVKVLNELKVQAISLNPCTVQKGTLVEKLFRRGQYRPPWLWTVLESLKNNLQKFPHIKILCEPTGVGSLRGSRNCGKCDKVVAQIIKEISLHQKITVEEPSCGCKDIWREVINLEDQVQETLIGLQLIPKLF